MYAQVQAANQGPWGICVNILRLEFLQGFLGFALVLLMAYHDSSFILICFVHF